ncbi:MAG TPA: hypothetical protein VIM55_03995 [Mucilaginibacter sp.]
MYIVTKPDIDLFGFEWNVNLKRLKAELLRRFFYRIGYFTNRCYKWF